MIKFNAHAGNLNQISQKHTPVTIKLVKFNFPFKLENINEQNLTMTENENENNQKLVNDPHSGPQEYSAHLVKYNEDSLINKVKVIDQSEANHIESTLIYSNYNQPTTLTSLSNNIDDDQLDPLCVDIESFKINHKLTNTEVLLAMIEVCSDQHYYNIRGSNKANVFWQRVVKMEYFGKIFAGYKWETLKKYWNLIQKNCNVTKFLAIVNEINKSNSSLKKLR